MSNKESNPKSIAQRFFELSLLILGGVMALWLALQALAQIWGWVLLLVGVAGVSWAAIAFARSRRNRW